MCPLLGCVHFWAVFTPVVRSYHFDFFAAVLSLFYSKGGTRVAGHKLYAWNVYSFCER